MLDEVAFDERGLLTDVLDQQRRPEDEDEHHSRHEGQGLSRLVSPVVTGPDHPAPALYAGAMT